MHYLATYTTAVAAAAAFALPASAAVMVDNSGQTAGEFEATAASVTGTLSGFTVGNFDDRLLVVGVVGEGLDNVDITDVTYGGVSGTQAVIGHTASDEFNDTAAIWYWLNPTVGTADIEATVPFSADSSSGFRGGFYLQAASFYNVDQTGPFDTGLDATNSNTSTASLDINVNAGGVIFEVIDTNNDQTPLAPTAGQTEWAGANQIAPGNDYTVSGAYELATLSGTQTQTWSLTDSEEQAFAAVSFNTVIPEPASAGLLAAAGLCMLRRRR